MKKHYNYLTIDLDKKIYNKLRAIQFDTKSRYILVNLISNNIAYDLTDATIKIFGIKQDKKIFFNNAVIKDVKNGKFEIELTNQALAVKGELKIQILVMGANGEKLTSSAFFIDIEESIVDENAIESTDEFNALTEGLKNLAEYDVYKNNVAKNKTDIAAHSKKLDEHSSQINDIGSELETNTNVQNFQKEYNLNELLRYKYGAKCLGGSTDDTIALQSFIDDLELEGENGKGGIIQLPAGEIRLDGLVFKAYRYFSSYNNKLIIKGSGKQATTLICDDNSNDNFIDFQGYYDRNGANRRQCANITFENLKLKCISLNNKKAINYNVTQYCDLKDVCIEGFSGGALSFLDSYDSNFYGVDIIKCGRANSDIDVSGAIEINGNNDCSNALHFTNCRLEFLPIFVLARSLDGVGASGRHIYFDNCKFEKLAFNTTSVRPFDLKAHNEWGFNNCMFVNSNEYRDTEYLVDGGLHFMKIDHIVSDYVTRNNQIQSTKFANCHFICPQKTFSNWGTFKCVHIINTDFNQCYGKSDNTECFYLRGENILDNVNISSQDAKLFAFDGFANNVKVNLLRTTTTTSDLVKVISGSNHNKLEVNHFSSVDTNFPNILNQSTIADFKFAGHADKYYLKNNIFKVLNDTTIKTKTSNLPNITGINNLINYTATQLNYLNFGFNGQIITISVAQATKIKHDSTLLKLKNKADLDIVAQDFVTLKNIDGVWWQI